MSEEQGSKLLRKLLGGRDLGEFLAVLRVNHFLASYGEQEKSEKSRRFHYIAQLMAELARLREKTVYGTRLCEVAIEAVIEGDLHMVKDWSRHFSELEPGVSPEMQKHFVPFGEILKECVLTWPGSDGPSHA